MTAANDNHQPRLMTKTEAADYCGVSLPTFRKWVRDGAIPGSLPRLGKWDRRAIDAMLDKLSGLDVKSKPVESELDKWVRENAAA